MKYRILIDQQAYDLHRDFDSLDVIDIGIMECIADFVYNERAEALDVGGVKYYWISHTSIIRDFPRSGIKSKGGIRKRIKKLEDVGLIQLYNCNQELGRSYYRITDKFNLTRKGHSIKERSQNIPPCPQNVGGCTDWTSPLSFSGQAPCPQKGNDYINNNTNNTITIYEEEEKKEKVDIISEIVDVYNSLGAPFRKVLKITKGRRTKANERLKEMGGKEKFISIIKKLPLSPFLRGENERGWVADFDFIIQNSEKWVKIEEGKYDKSTSANKTERKGKLEQYHNDPSLDDFDVSARWEEYLKEQERLKQN